MKFYRAMVHRRNSILSAPRRYVPRAGSLHQDPFTNNTITELRVLDHHPGLRVTGPAALLRHIRPLHQAQVPLA